jgi:hypothetical protein
MWNSEHPSPPPFGCLAGAQDKLALARQGSMNTDLSRLETEMFMDSRLRGNDEKLTFLVIPNRHQSR